MNKFNFAHNPLEKWVGEVYKVGPGGWVPPCFWQLESSLAVLAAAPGGQEAPHTLLGVPHRVLGVEWSLQGRAGSLSPVSTRLHAPSQGLGLGSAQPGDAGCHPGGGRP